MQSPYPADPIIPHHRPRRSRSYRWLQSLLIIGFSIFALISILALVVLWWFFGLRPTSPSPTALTLATDRIRPELALMYLAGDPVDALAAQALQADEYATSQALATYGVNAMPHPRVSLLLQLAQRFQEDGNDVIALQLLRQGRATAILDTALTAEERADVLMLCATGFLTLHREEEALDTARQVQRIAEQTPDILPAVRNRLLQELISILTQLPDEVLRQQVRELARNPYLAPSGMVIQERMPFADGMIEFDQQLTQLILVRQQEARQLAERMLQAPLADVQPLIQSLAQALQAENQQRLLYFNQLSSSSDLTFSLQFWFANEHRRWVILKLAIAHRAFGISLVPEWETDPTAINQELTEVTDLLQEKYLLLAQSQAEPLTQSRQRIVITRWFALQSEVGLYPERLEETNEALRSAQSELAQFGTSAALAVSYQADAISPGFRITANR